jgi:hypothetical protein
MGRTENCIAPSEGESAGLVNERQLVKFPVIRRRVESHGPSAENKAVTGGTFMKFRRPQALRDNIKGRPFWSRVWVLASIPTERNALNG